MDFLYPCYLSTKIINSQGRRKWGLADRISNTLFPSSIHPDTAQNQAILAIASLAFICPSISNLT